MPRFRRALAAATIAVAAAGGGLLIAAASAVPAAASARPAAHEGHVITLTAHHRAHAGGCAIHAPSLAGHPAGRHLDFVSCG